MSCPYLKFVSHTDETELPCFLFMVLVVVCVGFKELPDKFIFGFTYKGLQRHMQSVVVFLHKLGLRKIMKIMLGRRESLHMSMLSLDHCGTWAEIAHRNMTLQTKLQ